MSSLWKGTISGGFHALGPFPLNVEADDIDGARAEFAEWAGCDEDEVGGLWPTTVEAEASLSRLLSSSTQRGLFDGA